MQKAKIQSKNQKWIPAFAGMTSPDGAGGQQKAFRWTVVLLPNCVCNCLQADKYFAHFIAFSRACSCQMLPLLPSAT